MLMSGIVHIRNGSWDLMVIIAYDLPSCSFLGN